MGYCSNDSMDYKNVTGKHDSSSLAWLECCHKWQHSLPLFQEHRTVSVQRIRRCRRIVLPISSNHEGYTRDRTLLEDSSHCACRYERKRIRVHQRNLTETHRTCIKAMKVLAQFSQNRTSTDVIGVISNNQKADRARAMYMFLVYHS